eukprot:m.278658 g.278658  ORF g.278658 m.278658 type:complete len:54 (-) comp96750_c0_seq1:62-223(-)
MVPKKTLKKNKERDGCSLLLPSTHSILFSQKKNSFFTTKCSEKFFPSICLAIL